MNPMRGLEMVVIGKDKFFDILYDGGVYRDRKGQPVEGLLDMICFGCAAAYYTIEDQPIEFCPSCGQFERARFETLREIAQWSNKQNWKFLDRTGNQVFAVTRGDGWYLAFAKDRTQLEVRGVYQEINSLHSRP